MKYECQICKEIVPENKINVFDNEYYCDDCLNDAIEEKEIEAAEEAEAMSELKRADRSDIRSSLR